MMAILLASTVSWEKEPYLQCLSSYGKVYFTVYNTAPFFLEADEVNFAALSPARINKESDFYEEFDFRLIDSIYRSFKSSPSYEKFCYSVSRVNPELPLTLYDFDRIFYKQLKALMGLISRLKLTWFVTGPPSSGPDIIMCYLAEQCLMLRMIGVLQVFYGRFFWVTRWSDVGDYKTSAKLFERVNVKRLTSVADPWYVKRKCASNYSLLARLRATVVRLTSVFRASAHGTLFIFNLIFVRRFENSISRLGKILYISRSISITTPTFVNWDQVRAFQSERVVLFCLKFQPEASEMFPECLISNQIKFIEDLCRMVSNDTILVVKPHPNEWSSSPQVLNNLYADLSSMSLKHRICLLEPSIQMAEILHDCNAVATFDGSPGWEAIKHGIPAIVFGNPWYRRLPGVFKFDELINLSRVFDYKFDPLELISELEALSELMAPGFVVDLEIGSINAVDEFSPDTPLDNISKATVLSSNHLQVANSLCRIFSELERRGGVTGSQLA